MRRQTLTLTLTHVCLRIHQIPICQVQLAFTSLYTLATNLPAVALFHVHNSIIDSFKSIQYCAFPQSLFTIRIRIFFRKFGLIAESSASQLFSTGFHSTAAFLAIQSVVIGLPTAIPSLRPSDRPSHAGTLSRRMNE